MIGVNSNVSSSILMVHDVSNSHFRPNLSLSYNGTLMHLTRPTTTVEVPLVPFSPLVPARLQFLQINKKITTKSSTETELVAVHDKTGDILWTCHFLEAQGYTIQENIIFQDNMSTLSLEKSGRTSSSKRTKHTKVKYFFIQHYHHTNKITLQYFHTDNM